MRSIPTSQYKFSPAVEIEINSVRYIPLELSDISYSSDELSRSYGSVNATIEGEHEFASDVEAVIYFNEHEIFRGVIATPTKFYCGVTELEINLIIETTNVGFSPEEGQIDLINTFEPWPLGFGSPELQPAVKVRRLPTTTTKTKICLIDAALVEKKNRTENSIHQGLFLLGYMREALNIITDPSAEDTANLYIDILNLEYQLNFALRNSLNKLNVAQAALSIAPNSQQAKDAVDDAKALVRQTTIITELAIRQKKLYEQWIEWLLFFQQQKTMIAEQMRQIWRNVREQIYNLYAIEKKLCEQEICSNPSQLVHGSKDFEQNVNVNVRIAGLTFTVQFDGDSMTGITGPLNEKSNIVVKAWTQEPTPCSEYDYFDSMNIVYTDEPGLSNKWLLLTDTNGQKHVLYCESQIDDRCYLRLVPWSGARFAKVERGTIESLIYQMADVPIYPVFDNEDDGGWYNGDWDPSVLVNPESELYFEMIDRLADPNYMLTPEIRKNFATLAFLIPFDDLNGIIFSSPTPEKVVTLVGWNVASIDAVSTKFNPTWATNNALIYEELEQALQEGAWEAPPGTTVTEETCEIYCYNLLPSTLKGVYAYYQDENRRYLRPIPTRYFEDRSETFTGTTRTISPKFLIFNTPLSEIEGWEDKVYVSYESSVGPSIPSIIQHIAETYTDLSIDTTSFTSVTTAFGTKYPANFVVREQPDALALINQIAWESRLGVTIRDGNLHLTYLPAEPALEGRGVTSDTIIVDTREITCDKTEDLVTRWDVTWRETGVEDRPPEKLILRHNIDKHGLKIQTYDFLIFNRYDLVHKTMNFWLMRRSDQFKKIRADLVIDAINYHLLDGCTNALNKGRVLEWSYNHSTGRVSVLVETGIIWGESTPYQYFWPAAIDSSIVWPSVDQGYDITGSISCQPSP